MSLRLSIAALGALVLLTRCSTGQHGTGQPAPGVDANAESYEYIVIGSGAGGGPLAARLARAGKKVLLVEAGDDVGGKTKHDVPAMHALATEDPAMAWWFFVSHHADPAEDRADSKWTPDGVLYPRGSALGGSTAVNAMVTVLPSRSDWDRLATLTGDGGFRADAMDPYIDRVREWLPVEIPSPTLAASDPKVTAELGAASGLASMTPSSYGTNGAAGTTNLDAASATNLLGADVNDALRRGEATGFFRLPLATKNGRRNGTRERITDTVDAGFPLTVMTGTFATKILFDSTRASGVELVHASSIYAANLAKKDATGMDRVQVRATREVIVSAGTFNTPQILKLSGVGDPAELGKLGISVVAARPGVGQNLQDRVEASVVSTFSTELDVVSRCRLGSSVTKDPCLADWENGGHGVYQTPGFLATALLRSTDDAPLADLQVFAAPTDARGYYPGYSKDSAAAKNSFSWLILKAHTKNHDGTVTLADATPFSRPKIAFNSFDETDPAHDPDLLAVVRAIHFVRDVTARAAALLPDDPPVESRPGSAVQSDADLAAWVRREAWGHHACCTDRMGAADDSRAVVDPSFRVIGTQGLRVVDASVFPEIPGTFIAMPTYMIAERAADVILEAAK